MFLAPGATYTGIPPQTACPAALGDLVAALLVTNYIAFIVLIKHWKRS